MAVAKAEILDAIATDSVMAHTPNHKTTLLMSQAA